MIIVTDTETNGRDPAEVIELGWYQVSFPDLAVGPSFEQRYKPREGSLLGALVTHHILDLELEGMPPSSEASLPAGTTYMLGHNVDYDWKALGSPQVKRICTLAIARSLYPELDSHKLGAMLYHLLPNQVNTREYLKAAHSAKADAMMCYQVLCYMLEDKGLEFDSEEDLWLFSEQCRIPTMMAFGKHKGMTIKQLPRDYKIWMLKQVYMDPYLLQAVRASL